MLINVKIMKKNLKNFFLIYVNFMLILCKNHKKKNFLRTDGQTDNPKL